MYPLLGKYLKDERERKRVRLADLSRGLGYKNLTKGANRIQEFERTGVPAQRDLPERLATLLGIDPQTIKQLYQQDYERWQAWMDEPVPMRMMIRLMACVYGSKVFPPGTTYEEALAEAVAHAKEHSRYVTLIPSRRLTVWINRQGEIHEHVESVPGSDTVPYVTMRGRRFNFFIKVE